MITRTYILPSMFDWLLQENQRGLDRCKERLQRLFLTDNESVEKIYKIRSDEFFGLQKNLPVDLYIRLRYLASYLDSISKYLSNLLVFAQILKDKEKDGATDDNDPIYKCAKAVYQDVLNSTVNLLARKEINSDNIKALNLLNKTVDATIDICWALDPVEQSVRMLPVINDLTKASEKILCPYARRAVLQGLLLLVVLTLVLVPTMVLMAAPLLCVLYIMPLAVAAISWSVGAKAGLKFWSSDPESFKPLVKSMNTLFKCSSEETPSASLSSPSTLALIAS